MDNGKTDHFKDTVSDRLRRSREALNALRAETQAKARRAVRDTHYYAHDHPWRMVAAGAALAFIAGYVIKRSGSKKVLETNSPAPVIKVKRTKSKSRSGLEALSALAPVVLFALKAYQSRHSAAPNPSVNTSTPVM